MSESKLPSEKMFIDKLIMFCEYVNIVYANAGSLLEVLLLFLFFYLILSKKSWELKGFGILLSVGYLIDIFAQLCWIVNIALGGENFFWINATELSFIYCIASGSIWNTLLSLNRCSAILWLMNYSKVWSTKNIFIYCIPLLLYPIALQGYVIFDPRFDTEGMSLQDPKTNFLLVSRLILGTSNIFMAIIMLLMTVFVYFTNHKRFKLPSNEWKIKMLLQCVFTSFFMFFYSLFFVLAAILNPIDRTMAIICEYFTVFMYSTFHYGGIIVLLFVSKSIKKLFFQFYLFGKCKTANHTSMISPTGTNFISNHPLRRSIPTLS